MRRMTVVLMWVILVGATWAEDTIQLRDGKNLQGEVLNYANMVFEVRTKDGTVQRLPQAHVLRIAFKPRTVQLDTRNQGKVEGELRRYENGAFHVQPAKGAPLSIATVLIKAMSWGDAGESGGGDLAGGDPSRKVKKINNSGQRVDIRSHLVAGKVTIVDFYADWCGPCREIMPFLENLAKNDPEVYLRKVDIDRWGSPVAKQYEIKAIPRIEVYDRRGNQVPLAGPDYETAVRNAVVKAKDSR